MKVSRGKELTFCCAGYFRYAPAGLGGDDDAGVCDAPSGEEVARDSSTTAGRGSIDLSRLGSARVVFSGSVRYGADELSRTLPIWVFQ